MGKGDKKTRKQRRARRAEAKPSAAALLAQAHKHIGRKRHAQAVRALRDYLARRPDDSRAWHDLGAALFSQRLLAEAEEALKRAVQLDPGYAEAWGDLGTVQTGRGQLAEPLRAYLTACRLAPKEIKYRQRLGMVLLDQGHLDQAQRSFELILTLRPSHEDATAGLAMVHERRKQLDEAHRLLEPLMEAGCTHPTACGTWATVLRRQGQPAQAIPVLRRAIAATSNMASVSLLHHHLGDAAEAAGQFDEAFAAWTAGNRSLQHRFDIDAFRAEVAAIIQGYSQQGLASLQRAQPADQRPILVLGMPRSGTSLVEQILGRHPQVHPTGEREELRACSLILAQKLGQAYPGCLPAMDQQLATMVGRWYLTRLLAEAGDASVITDKMPYNFKHLGLAALLLPNTRVVHTRRSPMDCLLSCFIQRFKDPYAWTTRLDWLAEFYAGYRRLMDHWRSLRPVPMLELDYEALVAEPEAQVRRLLEFCELPWDDSCMQSHRSQRYVRTASYEQVGREIYTSSVDRWRRYERQLEPLRARLEEQGLL